VLLLDAASLSQLLYGIACLFVIVVLSVIQFQLLYLTAIWPSDRKDVN